jgi:hypothetical protein
MVSAKQAGCDVRHILKGSVLKSIEHGLQLCFSLILNIDTGLNRDGKPYFLFQILLGVLSVSSGNLQNVPDASVKNNKGSEIAFLSAEIVVPEAPQRERMIPRKVTAGLDGIINPVDPVSDVLHEGRFCVIQVNANQATSLFLAVIEFIGKDIANRRGWVLSVKLKQRRRIGKVRKSHENQRKRFPENKRRAVDEARILRKQRPGDVAAEGRGQGRVEAEPSSHFEVCGKAGIGFGRDENMKSVSCVVRDEFPFVKSSYPQAVQQPDPFEDIFRPDEVFAFHPDECLFAEIGVVLVALLQFDIVKVYRMQRSEKDTAKQCRQAEAQRQSAPAQNRGSEFLPKVHFINI